MTIDRPPKSYWFRTLLQLMLISLGLTFLFAGVFWGIDALNWGTLQDRNGDRAAGFFPFLYFSVETFFRIGYGIQTPTGVMWMVVTLEAMSHFMIEVIFVAHLVTLGLSRLISFSDRTRLENILNRF